MALKTHIRLLYKTAAEFSSANPLLKAGQPAIESDTDRMKAGDGITRYNDLEYFNPAGYVMGNLQLLQTDTKNTIVGAINELKAAIGSGTGSGNLPTLATPNVNNGVPTHNSVALTWNLITNAEKYFVYRNKNANSIVGASLVYSGANNYYTDSGLQSESTYNYFVIAKGFGVYNSSPGTKTITTTKAPINTPVVTFTGLSPNGFSINFYSPGAPVGTQYYVSIDGAAETIQTSPMVVSGLAPGSTHTITITGKSTTGYPSSTIKTITRTTQMGAVLQVLVIGRGDSFFAGIGSTGTTASSTYYDGTQVQGPYTIAKQLLQRLKQNTGANIVVNIDGYPGQTSSWFLNNNSNKFKALKDYLTAQVANYDIVLFIPEFGTNDEASASTTVAQLQANIKSINDQVKAISSKVLTIGYPLTNRTDIYAATTTNTMRNAYNAAIKANPASISADIIGDFASFQQVYADDAPASAYFNQADVDGLAGVHPTDLGALVIAEMLAQASAALAGVDLPVQPAISTTQVAATITIPDFGTRLLGSADFSPNANSTNAQAPITYASSNPAVATIVNGQVRVVGYGTAIIEATQPLTAGYLPAKAQRLLFVGVPTTTLVALATSGGTLVQNTSGIYTGPGYSVGALSYPPASTILIRANFVGNANNAAVIGLDSNGELNDYGSPWKYQLYPYQGTYYYSYNSLSGTKSARTAAAGDIYQLRRLGADGTVVAEVSSDGGNTFTRIYTFPDKLTGNIYTKISAGSATIQVNNPQVSSFGAPATVIDFPQPVASYPGRADVDPLATSTNTENPLVLSSSNQNVATIVNGQLHAVAGGSAVITASQVAGSVYPAGSVQRTFRVDNVFAAFFASGTLAQLSPGVWGSGYGVANQSIVANTDGLVRATWNSATNTAAVIALDVNNTLNDFNGATPWKYQLYVYNGFYYYAYGAAAGTKTNVVPKAGDIYQLRRLGSSGQVVCEVSSDGGNTYTTIYTFTTGYTGQLWVKGSASSNTTVRVQSPMVSI